MVNDRIWDSQLGPQYGSLTFGVNYKNISSHLPFRRLFKNSGSISFVALLFVWISSQNSLAASTMSPLPSCSDNKLMHTCVGAETKAKHDYNMIRITFLPTEVVLRSI